MFIAKLNICEIKVIVGVCLILFLRIFAMFMVVPSLSTCGLILKNSNMFLIGIAIGIYGIFQFIFQIPCGWLSDKFGRKKIIILGLIVFLLGNILCWFSDSIFGIIVGRGLQGSAAISSVCMALLSDSVISSLNRIKIMGILGIFFGISFFLAMILGPIIINLFGFYYLFFINSCLSIFCIFISIFFIPEFSINNNKHVINFKLELQNIFKILKNVQLFQINLSIFFIHFLLILNFITIPVIFKNVYGYFGYSLNIFYILIFIISFLVVFLAMMFIKTAYFYNMNTIIISTMMFLLCYILLLFYKTSILLLMFSLQIFFIVFVLLETILPILVGKFSLVNYKGTSMAIYSTSQFLGSALGGILGGFLFDYLNFFEISCFELILIVFWFLISIFFKFKNFLII
ncbi:MAG: MFS transporter [Buchnera aphidicola (Chaetogeoica yunlongensis)]